MSARRSGEQACAVGPRIASCRHDQSVSREHDGGEKTCLAVEQARAEAVEEHRRQKRARNRRKPEYPLAAAEHTFHAKDDDEIEGRSRMERLGTIERSTEPILD